MAGGARRALAHYLREQQEGLGGLRSVRGLPKNRYVGKGMFVWNLELRWRSVELDALGRSLHVVLAGFVNAGRVWLDDITPGELLADLHAGFGGGIKLGICPNFILSPGHGQALASREDAGRAGPGRHWPATSRGRSWPVRARFS